MTEILNYKHLENTNGENLIILHGLLGSLDNWITLGRAWSELFNVWLVDLRNHGKSFHSQTFDYEAMSEDIAKFINEKKISNPTILGHSMGGKVAMRLATSQPELVESIIVVDIAPKYYPVHHQKILQGLNAVPIHNLSGRSEAESILSKYISEKGVQQFLLKNLQRSSDGFTWKMNLESIEENIENVGEALDDNLTFEGKSFFLKGENSDYIVNNDELLIKAHFPKAKILTIKNAGHWIHAEQPKEVFKVVNEFIKA